MIPGTRPSGAETVRQTVHTSAPHFQDRPPPPRPEGPSPLTIWEEMPLTSCRLGSGWRRVSWALCFLLLLLEASSAKNIWKRALHARLAERSRVSAQAGGGARWEEMGDPRTVQCTSAPPRRGQDRAGVLLSLSKLYQSRVGSRWNSQPSKDSEPGSKEARGP